MPTDSTFIITQVLIATFACLCMSLAYVWFLKIKLNKLTALKKKKHTFEYAYDGAKVGKTASSESEPDSAEAGMDKLGELSGQQLSLSSQLREMTSDGNAKSLSDGERQRFLSHIEALEGSLQESGRQITSMNIQYQQASRDFEKEANKVSSLKRVVDAVDTGKDREEELRLKTQQLSDELVQKDKEIKKLRVSSSFMTKELDDLRADNSDICELKQSLDEAKQLLKRSEAERELLENNYVELEESTHSNKELREAMGRLRAEYDMLEQRFISSKNSDVA